MKKSQNFWRCTNKFVMEYPLKSVRFCCSPRYHHNYIQWECGRHFDERKYLRVNWKLNIKLYISMIWSLFCHHWQTVCLLTRAPQWNTSQHHHSTAAGLHRGDVLIWRLKFSTLLYSSNEHQFYMVCGPDAPRHALWHDSFQPWQ